MILCIKHFILIKISDSKLCCVLQLQKSCMSDRFDLAQILCLPALSALLPAAFRILVCG